MANSSVVVRYMFLAFVLAGSAYATEDLELPPEVNRWLHGYISRHKTFDGRPLLFTDARAISLIHGDLDGDGKDDVAVLFSVDGVRGGTDWVQYVAVFLRDAKGMRYCCMERVGCKGGAAVESSAIEAGRVILRGKAFVPGVDAYCCPSQAWETALKLSKLKPVRLVIDRPSNFQLEGPRANDARAPQLEC